MLPEWLQSAPQVFHGVRFDVHAVELPGRDGQSHRREVVVHPGAVVILPLLDPAQVVMIRNERFAVNQTLWELPAGTLEPGESAQRCAERELIEETGYRASEIRPLLDFYSSPGISTERMFVFVARGLHHLGQSLDGSEQITVQVVALGRAMQMVRTGQIIDGKSIAALLYYRNFHLEG